MKALFIKEPHVAEIIELDKPEPGPGEARVKVLCTGICGSEILAWQGRHFARKPPLVTGHEVCGIVDKVAPDVKGILPGARVAAMPQKTCGQCEWCLSGQENICASRSMLGFPEWQGSFAEYFVIPASHLFPVEDSVADTVGTLMEPLAVGVHAVRRSGVKKGGSLVVFGSGTIGLLSILAAREAGAATIIATDICDFNLELAKKMGAMTTHNASAGPVADLTKTLTGGIGVDAAIMAAEAPGLTADALNSLRIQGTLAIVASFDCDTPVNLQFLKSRELDITGSLTYDRGDFAKAVEMAHKYNADLEKMITHIFPLEKGADAFNLAQYRTENVGRIVFKVSERC